MRLMGKYVALFVAFALSFSQIEAHPAEAKSLDSLFACAHDERTHTPGHDSECGNFSIGFANNSDTLDLSYRDNATALQSVTEAIHSLLHDNASGRTRTIIIDGAASPLGNEAYNKRLALRRAEAVRDYIRALVGGGDTLPIHAISDGEDWQSFTRDISDNYHRSNRSKVLAVINSDASNDKKEALLRRIDNSGETFRILVANHMTSSRNAAVIHIVEFSDLAITAPVLGLQSVISPLEAELLPTTGFTPHIIPATPTQAEQETVQHTAPAQPETAQLRKPVVAIRSNLLVPALNIGVEIPIGTHWSVGADYYFPWVWPKRDNQNCFELLSWGVEARYWFGRNRTVFDRLQGHSVGVYGYMGYYDFERNYHGHQGEFVNVGVDYTYAMAVGKRKQVHFEFSLGVGYIYSQARKYTVIDAGGPLISDKITKKIGFFGPTKANISLVVPIFQKVKPNDKHRGDE